MRCAGICKYKAVSVYMCLCVDNTKVRVHEYKCTQAPRQGCQPKPSFICAMSLQLHVHNICLNACRSYRVFVCVHAGGCAHTNFCAARCACQTGVACFACIPACSLDLPLFALKPWCPLLMFLLWVGGDKLSSRVPFGGHLPRKCQAAEGFRWHVVEAQLDFPDCMKELQAHSLVHFCCISLGAWLYGTLYVLRM